MRKSGPRAWRCTDLRHLSPACLLVAGHLLTAPYCSLLLLTAPVSCLLACLWQAIYFGNAHWHGNSGAGTGPWAGADLEQGMYYGGGELTQKNNGSLPLTHDFVSLTLKGRADGFDLKGGDATKGKQMTMYSGPRPDRTIAGTCGGGGGGGAAVTLQKCIPDASNQTWGFLPNGKSIASGRRCLDINNYGTKQGSGIWAYPCGGNAVKQNENWAVKGTATSSLLLTAPYCSSLLLTAPHCSLLLLTAPYCSLLLLQAPLYPHCSQTRRSALEPRALLSVLVPFSTRARLRLPTSP
eukprot:SAG31_NODE_2935_length_4895_cov_5.362177_3_plen_295_part_00